MSQLTQLKDNLDEFIANIKLKVGEMNIFRFSYADAWGLLQQAVAEIVLTVEKYIKELPGEEKKRIALAYIGSFYDNVITTIDIPYVPNCIEPMFDMYFKKIFMSLAATTIDGLVAVFNATGVFE